MTDEFRDLKRRAIRMGMGSKVRLGKAEKAVIKAHWDDVVDNLGLEFNGERPELPDLFLKMPIEWTDDETLVEVVTNAHNG